MKYIAIELQEYEVPRISGLSLLAIVNNVDRPNSITIGCELVSHFQKFNKKKNIDKTRLYKLQ